MDNEQIQQKPQMRQVDDHFNGVLKIISIVQGQTEDILNNWIWTDDEY
jgi:hypothetical protein